MKNMKLLGFALCAGLAGSAFAQCPGAPTPEFDYGTLGAGTATTNVIMATNEVHWLKFTLAAPLSMSSLSFLNIDSAGNTVDIEYGLYDCAGNLVATDDDDGNGVSSAFTFGSGDASVFGTTTQSISNGRDGALAAGEYYLAVIRFNAVFANGFAVTPGTATTGATVAVNATLGTATALPDPAGTINLGTLSLGGAINRVGDPLAAGQVQWYKVAIPEASLALNQYVDMDTEGSALSTNTTRISVYNVTGAVTGTQNATARNNVTTALTDTTDGSGSLSQVSLGVGTRVAVGSPASLAYNGRDGNLQAGTYLIAVAGPGNAPSGAGTTGLNFGHTSTSTTSGSINLNLGAGFGAVPLQGTPSSTPTSVNNCGTATSLLRVTVIPATTPPGPSTGITVNADLSGIGLANPQQFFDDGSNGDVTPGDNIFSYSAAIANTVTPAAYTMPFNVSDAQARTVSGNLALTVTLCPPPPPANDQCANAIVVGTGSVSFNTTSAISDGTTTCGGTGPDIFYSFTPVASGPYQIDTCGSSFDTTLGVFTACGGTQIVCNDTNTAVCGAGSSSALVATLTAGTPYIIQVDGFGGANGAGVLNIGLATVPLAVAGNAVTAQETTSALLRATVTPGNPPLSSGVTVTGDLSSIGGSATQAFFDDGSNGDVTPGDNIFSYSYTLPLSVTAAAYSIPVNAADAELRTASGTIALTVSNGPSGACCNAGCSLTRQTLCVAGGGSWQGNGSSCGFGYTMTAGSDPFIDISATGTLLATISNIDDGTQAQSLPFTFTHLGNAYTSVNVSSNGNLQFGASNSTTFANVTIPNAAVPNDMLAPLWDDFDMVDTRNGPGLGGCYYLDDSATNNRVIFSWQGVGQYNTANPVVDSNDFQVILYSNGNAEFRYGNVPTILTPQVAGDTVTIGYEDSAGASGGEFPGASVGTGNMSITLTATNTDPCGPVCDSVDFNNDTLFPDTLDIDDFLSVFSGGACSNDPFCGDIDFNNDTLFPDTLDIDALLSVFSGGACLI